MNMNMNTNPYDNAKHKRWRERVLRRAGYLCEECSRYGKRVPATIAHHIHELKDFPEQRYELSNGQALCMECHNKKHPDKGRFSHTS